MDAASVATAEAGGLPWRPVDPHNPSGTTMAALWGDPASVPYGALLRIPAGFQSPMHAAHTMNGWSSSREPRSIGSRARIPPPAPTLRAGDVLRMPAGVNHVSAATADQDCLELITHDGKFDFTLAAATSS